jgi:DNA-binding GntR family transcriptional regulator
MRYDTSNLSVSVDTELAIRKRIATGQISAGEWLREETLAGTLGVSRTPVREACSRLSRDGLLEWVPNRGYRAPPLLASELDAVYPVLMALEALAVASLPGKNSSLAAELRGADFDLTTAGTDAAQLFAIDRAWHRRVVQDTGNPVLLELHDRLTARLERYLLAYWGKRGDVDESVSEHVRIADAIGLGDTELAAALLRLHRRHGLDRIQKLIWTDPAG